MCLLVSDLHRICIAGPWGKSDEDSIHGIAVYVVTFVYVYLVTYQFVIDLISRTASSSECCVLCQKIRLNNKENEKQTQHQAANDTLCLKCPAANINMPKLMTLRPLGFSVA